jgi:gliding motility-associated lipoprotein GldH
MKNFYVILVVLICLSCGDRRNVFEKFIQVEGKSWNSSQIIQFNVNIPDTTEAHNIYIMVRNTSKYQFSNLFLFTTVHAPDGSFIRDTVEIPLADERGKWLGKGAASIFTTSYPYRTNIRFPLPGIYIFDIEQAMWNESLEDINDVGLKIEKIINKP